MKKKILLLFLIVLCLAGCGTKKVLQISILDEKYELVPEPQKKCSNIAKEYYSSSDGRIYLVCLNEISIKADGLSDILQINTLRDYFSYRESILKNDTIVVYLNNDITQEQILTVKEKIDNYENIAGASVIKTKEEWKNEMSESSDTFSKILGNISENPLSDTVTAQVKNIDLMTETVNYIENLENVKEVQYVKDNNSDYITSSDVIADFISNITSNNTLKKSNNYNNGEVKMYTYDNLAIITCDTSNGNQDIYIGTEKLEFQNEYCK